MVVKPKIFTTIWFALSLPKWGLTLRPICEISDLLGNIQGKAGNALIGNIFSSYSGRCEE